VEGAHYPPRTKEKALAYFHEQMRKHDSWLHPDNFPKIKAMTEKNQIDTVMLELSDSKRFDNLDKWLNDNHLRIGDLYLSSVLGFATPINHYDYWGRVNSADVRKRAYINLKRITDGNTRVLNSCSTAVGHGQTTEFSKFVLNIEGNNSDNIRAIQGIDVPSDEQVYRYATSAGHAPIMLVTPSDGIIHEALNKHALGIISDNKPTPTHMNNLNFLVDWETHKLLQSHHVLSFEINCPDYIPDNKCEAFINNAEQIIEYLAIFAPKSQGNHALSIDKNNRKLHYVFSVPKEKLIENSNYVGELANTVTASILKKMPKGLEPEREMARE
jgi:hypothetical protein